MIKRVVAVEGDEVEYRGASLFVNGKFIGENNVWAKQQLDKSVGKKDKLKIIYEPFSFKLKNGEYYVVGDNQDFSIDSRNFGPISSDCVISIISK
jgi:signal peptidase I